MLGLLKHQLPSTCVVLGRRDFLGGHGILGIREPQTSDQLQTLADRPTTDSVRSQARRHAYLHTNSSPYLSKSTTRTSEAGGLNEKNDAGRDGASAARVGDGVPGGGEHTNNLDGGAHRGRDAGARAEVANANEKADATKQSAPPPAPPPDKSQAARSGDSALEAGDSQKGDKGPIHKRAIAGSKRFVGHFKDAVFSSWVNVLLVFVPVGIAVEAVGASPAIIFAMNAIAIVPLAGLLSHATESVAARLGDTLGALLNVSFGNAVELIIFIIALVKREIGIVQASLLGSILANLLLILGMAFLLGGLRYREQVYNSTITQMSACLLSLSVMSLLLPTAFHASFNTASAQNADNQVLKVSRGTSVVLLLVYILYLAFQLKSHSYLYESTPQAIIDEESHPGVLADIMNSSSSSDTSSSSSSDSDGSASITTAGKKIKRAFKQRRRRKSSASTSSVTNSATNSALSSPSAAEHRSSYLGNETNSSVASRRPSALNAGDADGDADREDNHGDGPRVRDFGKANGPSSNSSESKKHKKKFHRKKHRKHRKDQEAENGRINDGDVAIVDDHLTEEPEPTVQFADEVQTAENTAANATPSRSGFNMRLASSLHRPALPKMLSNNVFVTPPQPQYPQSHPRPLGPSRSASAGRGLRRTSSLPDRLNQQYSNQSSRPIVVRTDAMPPYPRQPRHANSDQLTKNDDDDDEDSAPQMSRTAAVVLLLCSTALVAVCAEFMVDAIPHMLTPGSAVSQTFIGLIILPIVGNAAEHVTAVTVAAKNKMDLAIGVAIGSSIQIALFITPLVVLLGWMMDRDMSLYFNLFETISLFVTAFVVNFLILDGRSNYLEGSLLIAAYVIIALAAFFYPATANQSAVGSVGTDGLGR